LDPLEINWTWFPYSKSPETVADLPTSHQQLASSTSTPMRTRKKWPGVWVSRHFVTQLMVCKLLPQNVGLFLKGVGEAVPNLTSVFSWS